MGDQDYIDAEASWAKFEIPVKGLKAESKLRGETDPVRVSKDGMKVPPLFELGTEFVQPIAGDDAGLAEAFAFPGNLHETVSVERPMRVEISPHPDRVLNAKAIVPVLTDGEFFYLAGPPVDQGEHTEFRQGKVTYSLNITQIPDVEAAPPSQEVEARISGFRSLKLGFFKIVGIPTSLTGLRYPELKRGRVEYRSIKENELATGRVAMLVHGFLSETSWLASALKKLLMDSGYEHVVTFDYETITTEINETSMDLVTALQRAGVQANSQRIDVIAHSMGSLVSRSLVSSQSQLPGAIRRILLMGPPNAGTPIAYSVDGAVRLVSALINLKLGPVPVGPVLRFLADWVDNGLDDLQPNSKFITKLNTGLENQTTPITVVAGNATARTDLHPLITRILGKTAKAFYGGENDLVVPVESMTAIANLAGDSVTVVSSDSNHFSYLNPDSDSLPVVEEWIRQGDKNA
ncbi:lipase family alpha/beta hydrolase [Rhodopirellula sp. MGV]|uniref:lipase family alpha/beta hydrolase n=1 Tax=Rhodopirellula sp. MGV TaxID=2023130 RepID=UPI000B97A307|nr:hypothetical protein [Rhodopirellula sp. MGV]OYP35375.1 hypothetical protein CGZ80_11945 [Rhodopirellula sp. MGV]PNY37737.1 hypothetical protein C2E31_06275 [Rhodopirellula baltica]